MIRAICAAAAIVLGATVTGAHAQTQTAPPEAAVWEHNGSVMYLVENGSSREFHYQKPRPGMLEAGARPGSLLFRGRDDNGRYAGTAYIFNPHCGPIPFQVTGSALDNDERIVLTGQAPLVGRKCRIHRTYTSSLEFKRLKPVEAAQSQEPAGAAPVPDLKDEKPEAPSQVGGALSSAPATQPSVMNETPSTAKDSSRRVAEHKEPGTPTAEPSVTNKIPSAAKDLENCRAGALLIVMIASLFGFSLVISLRTRGLGGRRWLMR